jgi:hypothetical protein
VYVLTSACASEATQTYALIAHSRSGSDRTIAIGQTGGGFGEFTAVNGGLAYVALAAPGVVGLRGPLSLDAAGQSTLWLWDLASGSRARLAQSDTPITGLGR